MLSFSFYSLRALDRADAIRTAHSNAINNLEAFIFATSEFLERPIVLESLREGEADKYVKKNVIFCGALYLKYYAFVLALLFFDYVSFVRIPCSLLFSLSFTHHVTQDPQCAHHCL